VSTPATAWTNRSVSAAVQPWFASLVSRSDPAGSTLAAAWTRCAADQRVVSELELPAPEAEIGHPAHLGGHSRGRPQADGLERAEGFLLDPAEQARYGKAQELAAQVPHRGVDGGLAGQVPDDQRVHPVGQDVRLERVALEHEGGQFLDGGLDAAGKAVKVVPAQAAGFSEA
jgi:hypothetical protein